MSWPAIAFSRVPLADAAMMRRADAEAAQRFGIEARQLMEVAGFQVARFLAGRRGGVAGRRVAVVAGAGNNGGDALVAARFLSQLGAGVIAWILEARDPTSLAASHARTLRAMGIACRSATDSLDLSADLILDGLLGTGVRLPLRHPAPALISAINRSTSPVIAIDLPSGLDSDTGAGDALAVQAEFTVTLGLPKPALATARSPGQVFLADIGLPAALFGPDQAAVAAVYAEGSLLELVRPIKRQVDGNSPPD
ncbi:MAG: NAD(P)H-hydrate epimerase [Candidatus Dormibacteraeota bacterium]|nr:NAD(P)H-hydrate epimerase [Candidatus Dormibacteraeota bacterium]